jgi:hypothetical protein
MIKRFSLLAIGAALLSPLQAVKIHNFSEETQRKIKNAKGPEEIREIINGSYKAKVLYVVPITYVAPAPIYIHSDMTGDIFDKGTVYQPIYIKKYPPQMSPTRFFPLPRLKR